MESAAIASSHGALHCGHYSPAAKRLKSPLAVNVQKRSRGVTTQAVLQRDSKDVARQKSGKQNIFPRPSSFEQPVNEELVKQLNSLLVQPAVSPVDSNSQPVDGNAVETEYCYHFAYGANMSFATLSKRDVRVASRDPATVKDPAIRMLFKHRGGECATTTGEGG